MNPLKENKQQETDPNLENLVSEYLSKCLSQKKEEGKGVLRRAIAKINPTLSWLLNNQQIPECRSLEDVFAEDDQSFYKVVEHTANHYDSYDAGLCIGFLQPSIEINPRISTSTPLKEGLKDGQIYRLKIKGKKARKHFYLGLLCLAGFLASRNPEYYNLEKFDQMEKISDALTIVGKGSMLYGVYAMLKTRLFMKDAFISRKLIKNGLFKLHRNPFYTGMIFGGLAGIANTQIQNVLSDNPNPTQAALAVGSLMSLAFYLHQRVLTDEKVLEKTFGQEYRDYKAKTPRYFPAIWNLFRKS